MKTVDFAEILSRYMQNRGIGDQKLANLVNNLLMPSNIGLHRSNIRNWRSGGTKSVRDWRYLVAIAYVLQFERDELEALLKQSKHGDLESLRCSGSEQFARLIDHWLEKREFSFSGGEAESSSVDLVIDSFMGETNTQKSRSQKEQNSPDSPVRERLGHDSIFRPLRNVRVNSRSLFWGIIISIVLLALTYVPRFLQPDLAEPTKQIGWYARGLRNDDIDIILVNDRIVGTTYPEYQTDWICLDDFLQPGKNVVSFIHMNGPGPGDWEFELAYDGRIKWHSKASTRESFTVSFVGRLELLSDGEMRYLNIPDTAITGPKWNARLDTEAIGILFVNGYAAAGAYRSAHGQFAEQDISRFIVEGDNRFELLVWNPQKWYSYDIEIKKDDLLIWRSSDQFQNAEIDQLQVVCVNLEKDGGVMRCE